MRHLISPSSCHRTNVLQREEKVTHQEVDKLPIAPGDEVGAWTENDYALIYDSKGRAWSTETRKGIRMKVRHYLAVELDLAPDDA